MRKTLLAFLLTLLASGASLAQWKVVGGSGEKGKDRSTARVENKDGHALSIYRQANGSVWASFEIPAKGAGELAADRAPTYQVDAHPVRDLGTALKLQGMGTGFQAYAWEPRRVSFVLTMGAEHDIGNEKLEQLMEGRNLVVRYTLASGAAAQASFTLNAAKNAIAHALDIPTRADAALAENPGKFKVAYREALKRCSRQGERAKECVERALTCSRQRRSDDLEVFQACAK